MPRNPNESVRLRIPSLKALYLILYSEVGTASAVRHARVRFSARHPKEVPSWEWGWGDGEEPRRMTTDECTVKKTNKKSGIMQPKPLKKYLRVFIGTWLTSVDFIITYVTQRRVGWESGFTVRNGLHARDNIIEDIDRLATRHGFRKGTLRHTAFLGETNTTFLHPVTAVYSEYAPV
jgi:hypothetical protein